jgi:phosphoglycerol transferase MdoB-like AlkP superfamily enzyme
MNNRFRTFLSSISPSKTFLFFSFIFLIGTVFLSLFRFGFLLKHSNLIADIPSSTLFHSFIIGARFDMVVLSFLLIPLFLLSHIPFISMNRLKASRVIIETLFLICLSLIFFLSLVDIEYYGEFGTRLSHWAFEYLDQPGMMLYSMWSNYPVTFYLLLWGALTFVFAFFVIKLSGRIFYKKRRERIGRRLAYFILGCALLFLGARGRWQLAPIDWGLAYFSPYGFANQLALNGIYTLGKSWWEDYHQTKGEAMLKKVHFFSHSEALSTVQKSLFNPKEKLTDPEHSLARWYYPDSVSNETKDYNVVIIQLESWLARFVGALGGKPDATPNFDSLAQRGILFERFFATGTRTNRGIVSNLCSFPSQAGRSIMKRYSANHIFTSIADILKTRGYPSLVIYGGDLQFDNMEGFLRGQGFERFIGEQDFPFTKRSGKWGVSDHLVFERANEEFVKFGDKPFLGVIVTVTNHEPFDLPSDDFRIFPKEVRWSDYLNTFYYSDWALGEFLRQAEKQPYFKNTVFVLVADHGKLLESQSDFPQDRFHIACLIYAPYILGTSPKRISTVAGQTDLIPTILGILGKPAFHQSWGRDLLSLSPEDEGFAMMVDGQLIGWMEGHHFLVERIGASCALFDTYKDPLQKHDLSSEFPDLLRELQTKEHSFLQLSIETTMGEKSLVQ